MWIVSTPDPTAAEIQDCLLVTAGGELFGIPASRIIRVLRDVTVHPIPGARPPLVGLGQYGGEPVAVVDLLELVRGRASGSVQRVVVLVSPDRRMGHEMIGLAVDEATRLDVSGGSPVSGPPSPPVVGWIEADHRRIEVVDPTQIVVGAPEPTPTEDEGEEG